MKRKIATLVVVTAFIMGYSTYNVHEKKELTDITMSNVEALATGSESNVGTYAPASGQCAPPKEYKRWTACPKGTEVSCYPSDC